MRSSSGSRGTRDRHKPRFHGTICDTTDGYSEHRVEKGERDPRQQPHLTVSQHELALHRFKYKQNRYAADVVEQIDSRNNGQECLPSVFTVWQRNKLRTSIAVAHLDLTSSPHGNRLQ